MDRVNITVELIDDREDRHGRPFTSFNGIVKSASGEERRIVGNVFSVAMSGKGSGARGANGLVVSAVDESRRSGPVKSVPVPTRTAASVKPVR